MVHMFVFSQEFALFSVGIILLQQRSNNSLFVGLNGGFMIDSKGLQMGQCHKKHRIVKPFASLLKKEEKETLYPNSVTHERFSVALSHD